MSFEQIRDLINQEIVFAEAAIESANQNNTYTYPYWDGYRSGLIYARDLLNQKIDKFN